MMYFLRQEKYRGLFYQVLLVCAVIGVMGYFYHTAQTNLQNQGIASGFSFLQQPAGFDIIQHLISYTEQSSYGRALVVALLNTILLSVLGIFFATILGFVIGIARLSQNWLLSKIAAIYIEIFRNIPLLLQLFFWYFAVLRTLPNPRNSFTLFESVFINLRGIYLPRPIPSGFFHFYMMAIIISLIVIIWWVKRCRRIQSEQGEQKIIFIPILCFLSLPILLLALIFGSPVTFELPVLKGFNFKGGIVIIPELAAMLLALSIYTASFIAEIVRAGILSVSRGQSEAAQALGLHHGLTLRLIIIPQALRVIVPPLTSQFLNLTKNSSLAAAIAYPELVSVFAGTVLNQTGQAIEVIAITMSIYLLLSLIISAFMNWYNKRMALVSK